MLSPLSNFFGRVSCVSLEMVTGSNAFRHYTLLFTTYRYFIPYPLLYFPTTSWCRESGLGFYIMNVYCVCCIVKGYLDFLLSDFFILLFRLFLKEQESKERKIVYLLSRSLGFISFSFSTKGLFVIVKKINMVGRGRREKNGELEWVTECVM